MRNAEAPVILLTRAEHMRQLNSYWRQKDADRLRDECIFVEEGERSVAAALREFDPWPAEKPMSLVREMIADLPEALAGATAAGLFVLAVSVWIMVFLG